MTSTDNIFSEFENEYEKEKSKTIRPNIIILGCTGSGKSSLVNLVFGDSVAIVGEGKPVTQGIDCHKSEKFCIFDTKGYESGKKEQAEFRERVLSFVDERNSGRQLNSSSIHLAWYCIPAPGHRVFDIDASVVNLVRSAGIPVAIVLTKSDQVSEEDSSQMEGSIKTKAPGVKIFSVSTDPNIDLGPDELLDWSYENLDESVKSGFARATDIASGIKLKRRAARNIYLQHAGIAATAAASPIPFSDAPLLMANQLTMIARLSFLWELPALKSQSAGALAAQFAAVLGRSLAGNIVKFIPGAGTIAGGTINATIASSFTMAIGWAVSEIAEKYKLAEHQGENVNFDDYFSIEIVKSLISAYMKKDMNRAG